MKLKKVLKSVVSLSISNNLEFLAALTKICCRKHTGPRGAGASGARAHRVTHIHTNTNAITTTKGMNRPCFKMTNSKGSFLNV